MDADLNHQPEEVAQLIAAAERSGCDILVGSRMLGGSAVDGTPLWKRWLSQSVNRLMRYLYGLDVRDKTSGFRVYRASALRRIRFDNDAFAFLPEVLIRASRAGMSVVEAPIHFVFRREGRSKMRIWDTSVSYLGLLASSLRRSSARPRADDAQAEGSASRSRTT